MGLIDIVILIIIATGAIRGFLRGFIHQLASIAGLVVGFLAARTLYFTAAEKLAAYIPDATPTLLQVVAFVGIWLVVPLLFTLIASFFTHAAEMLSLGAFNQLLGLFLGVGKWVLILGLLFNVLDRVDPENCFIGKTKKNESALYYPIKDIVGHFFPTVENITDPYITL